MKTNLSSPLAPCLPRNAAPALGSMSNKLQLLGWPPLESFTWLRQLQEPSLLDVSTAPKACSSIVSCSCLHQIVTLPTLPSPLRPAQMFNFWGFCECRAAHRSYQNLYLNSFYMLEEPLPLRKQRSSSPWRTEASFGVSTSQGGHHTSNGYPNSHHSSQGLLRWDEWGVNWMVAGSC